MSIQYDDILGLNTDTFILTFFLYCVSFGRFYFRQRITEEWFLNLKSNN